MHLPLVDRRILQGLRLWLICLCLGVAAVGSAHAQGVQLVSLSASRDDAVVALNFVTRLTLPKTVEDALEHGVPIYFVAQADLKRERWYWRDERVARITRQWRLAFQPLTGSWRVGLAGINQNHATLEEAVSVMSRSAGWRLADAAQIDGDSRYYVDFSYKLDTTQLPGPMQFGVGVGEWTLGVERSVRVERVE